MKKEFHLNSIYLDNYIREERNHILLKLLYFAFLINAPIAVLIIIKGFDLTSILFCLVFDLILFFFVLKKFRKNNVFSISFKADVDVVSKISNKEQTTHIPLPNICKIKKTRSSILLYEKGKPKFVQMRIPINIEEYQLLERYIVENTPTAEKEGF